MIKDIILGLMWAMPFVMLMTFASFFSMKDNKIIEFYARVFLVRPKLLVVLGLSCIVLICFLSPQIYYENSHNFKTHIFMKGHTVTVTGEPRYSILIWAGVMIITFPIIWLYTNLLIDRFILKKKPDETSHDIERKIMLKINKKMESSYKEFEQKIKKQEEERKRAEQELNKDDK